MAKHKSATGKDFSGRGTVGPMKPLSSKDLGQYQAPGPAFPGTRAERASHGNIYNDNSDGKRAWNKLTPGLIKDVRKT